MKTISIRLDDSIYEELGDMLDAIEKDSFADFEACLQDKCAKEVGADYIITCNVRDFENS